MEAPTFKGTPLRELYDILCRLSEGEQLGLARFYAEEKGAQRLAERFELSCAAITNEYPENTEPFHDRTSASDGDSHEVGPPSAEAITSTVEMQEYLAGRGRQEVRDQPELGFRYVDREVFALRTTAKGGVRPPKRTLDLLLASDDNYPIIGEVKIAGDRPTFFALVQALMYASELSSPNQRRRLQSHYAAFDSGPLLTAGPWLDVWVIGYQPPEVGEYRQGSFEASEQISAHLINESRVNQAIRRIAYVEAVLEGVDLTFEEKFRAEPERPGSPAT